MSKEPKLRADLQIGTKLKEARLEKGLVQREVVAMMQVLGCSISKMTYSKIERNECNIRISELVALKIILSLSYSKLFGDLEVEFLENCKGRVSERDLKKIRSGKYVV